MTSIPLYLKIKSPKKGKEALFETIGERSIILNDKQYDFTKIYNGSSNTYKELIDTFDPCSYFIFMGPTGSGKTTTLKQVIYEKIHRLEASAKEACITAFEVSENKYIIDLLETPAKKKEYHSSCLESQLHKRKLNGDSHEVLKTVFNKRNTKKTAFNSESSRSCLVVTFFYDDKRVIYIDLMGNEKYDKSLALSNAFANTNMSSITQLLTNKVSSCGRSSNLITNLIFKSNSPSPGKINIILNVDPNGDITLLKSILNNIATLVKDFKLETTTTNKLDKTPNIPHYAKPTISSLSPTRLVPRMASSMSPMRKLSSTPSKFRMIPSSDKLSTAPKLMGSRVQKFQTPTKNAFIAPIKTSLPYKASHLTNNFYEIQISSLKKTIKDLEIEISDFKHEHKEILQKITIENQDLSHSLIFLQPDNEPSSLKGELNDLISVKAINDELLKQKNILNEKVNDFKVDFYKFKLQHSNFTSNIDALKKIMDISDTRNSQLTTKNKELLEEVSIIKEDLSKVILENSAINSHLDRVSTQNKSLMQTIEDFERDKTEKQLSMDKLAQENKLLQNKSLDTESLVQKISDLQQVNDINEGDIKSSRELIAEQQKNIELKDSIIIENDKKVTELTKSANLSLENQHVIENLQNELTTMKSEIQQLTSENKLINSKHAKSIEELKTYKYKFKTLNNSWAQKFDKIMKTKDQGLVKLRSELNSQNGISGDLNRKFLGSDIFEDKPQSSTQMKPVPRSNPLQPSNISKLDNRTNKTFTLNKNSHINKINNLSKIKKSSKKKSQKNTNKLQPI
ncbi:unnamed protein product [Debaryomyces tyrocola]|nr:unnamed protein product [Debaryomyces tyrocola]